MSSPNIVNVENLKFFQVINRLTTLTVSAMVIL